LWFGVFENTPGKDKILWLGAVVDFLCFWCQRFLQINNNKRTEQARFSEPIAVLFIITSDFIFSVFLF
jgi:hypothetical protein